MASQNEREEALIVAMRAKEIKRPKPKDVKEILSKAFRTHSEEDTKRLKEFVRG